MKAFTFVLAFLALIAYASAVTIPDIARRWYVAGKFTHLTNTDGTQFAASNFAYWDGSKWGSVSSLGTNGPVYTVKMDIKFNLMIGGAFTTVNGVATGPVARYSTALSKWEKLHNSGTFTTGSIVKALATNCFSLSLNTITSTRCDVYFGGKFSLTDGSVTATNVARWMQKTDTEGTIENLGSHGIGGTVYALYKKAIPTLTSASTGYLWVGGDLKPSGNGPKWFGRFEDVTDTAKVKFVNLDDNMNGPVHAFQYVTKYIITQTDELYVAGAFNFTSTGSVRCYGVCQYDHKTKKFIAIAGTASPNFDTGAVYDIGLNGGQIVAGGSFSKPTAYLSKLDSGKATWDFVQGQQTNKVTWAVKTIDVCSQFSKSCTSGSVAAGSSAGKIAFFDNEKAVWENFGVVAPLNQTAGVPELHKIYSFAAAGSVKVTFAILAVIAMMGLVIV